LWERLLLQLLAERSCHCATMPAETEKLGGSNR
jgi:hypothetical protein